MYMYMCMCMYVMYTSTMSRTHAHTYIQRHDGINKIERTPTSNPYHLFLSACAQYLFFSRSLLLLLSLFSSHFISFHLLLPNYSHSLSSSPTLSNMTSHDTIRYDMISLVLIRSCYILNNRTRGSRVHVSVPV